MHICLLNLYYNPEWADCSPHDYLEKVPIERHLPQALAAAGHQVDVVLLYPKEAYWSEGQVHYHFIPAARPLRQLAKAAGRLTGREWTRALPALAALRRVRRLQPDIIHFHGLILTMNLLSLWLYLGRRAPPVVAHYHGGFPSSNRLIRRVQAFTLRRLSRALFTTRDHARPFVEAGLLRAGQVAEVMEVSTAFTRQPRPAARALTGMAGSPVFLWAGRLHPVKDPLTALQGFSQVQAAWPDAHLYFYYLTAELLPELHAFLAARPHLLPHVHFGGRLPHRQMEAVFNSADFFLQASHREYSGYAVLEAMACGVIPVVTDIPSFRIMTGGGQYGILFPAGDAAALARQVLAVNPAEIPHLAASVRNRFEQAFSYPALAAKLTTVYSQLLSEKK